MASPLEIKIALHYYAMPGDYDGTERGSGAFSEIVETFLRGGLLVTPGPRGATLSAGPALAIYVEALCAIPFPVQKWVIPDARPVREPASIR